MRTGDTRSRVGFGVIAGPTWHCRGFKFSGEAVHARQGSEKGGRIAIWHRAFQSTGKRGIFYAINENNNALEALERIYTKLN